jgi:hypothetical protein
MRFRPFKALSTSFTAIIIILAFPAAAILASWNSIPGSILYPVKTGLEKAALALLPNSVLEMGLRFKLIDRRLEEAQVALIQQGSGRAFQNIVTEAKAAQLALEDLNPQEKTQTRQLLIEKLTETSGEISQTATTIATSSTTSTTSDSPPTTSAYIPPSDTTPPDDTTPPSDTTPPPPEPDASDSLEDAEEELGDIIDDLEEEQEAEENGEGMIIDSPAAIVEPSPEPKANLCDKCGADIQCQDWLTCYDLEGQGWCVDKKSNEHAQEQKAKHCAKKD